MIAAAAAEAVARAAGCRTTRALETVWMAWLRVRGMDRLDRAGRRAERTVIDAVEKAGWVLVEAHALGHLIPRITVTRRYVVTLGTDVYKTGWSGNGAGLRYARIEALEWYARRARFRRPAKMGGHQVGPAMTVFDWVMFRMPHRALRALVRVRGGAS